MPTSAGLSVVDYVVIAIYMLAMIAMGYVIGQKQKNTEDYFLAGRKMTWWPIALSLFASLFSAISYVAMPGEAFNYGMNMALSAPLALLPIPIMVLVFLRLFYNLKLWTAYQYLEMRFDVNVRLLGGASFLLLRGFYLGVVLYATALVLQPAMGWSVTTSILVVGLSSTIYTAMGGMAAVIWTDVVQTIILIGGVFLVIGMVAMEVTGGVAGIWSQAAALGHGFDLSAESGIWSWNLNQRIVVWVWLISLVPMCISPATDQVNLQRCLSSRSLKTAGGAVFASGLLSVVNTFLFYFAGLAVLVYFRNLRPDALPPGMKGDLAFTHFISHHLPIGVRGLLMAAILAAVMSTVTAVINSLAAVTIKDFYERIIRPGRDDAHYMRASYWMTWVWGLGSIGLSLMIVYLYASRDIPLLEVSTVTLGFFGNLVLGVFMLGLLTYRGTSFGAFAGVFLGGGFSAWLTWVHYLQPAPEERLSFLWLGLIGLGSVFVSGYVFSWLESRPDMTRIWNYVVWSQWRRIPTARSQTIGSKAHPTEELALAATGESFQETASHQTPPVA